MVLGGVGGGGLTEFLCQVALSSQLPVIVLVVVVALQGLAVVVHQGELGAEEGQLDGGATCQGFNGVFKRCSRMRVTRVNYKLKRMDVLFAKI